jgi:hypothetical protein
MRFALDGDLFSFPPFPSNSNNVSGDKQDEEGGAQPNYDPDLAHPAAGFGDSEQAVLPNNVNERKLMTKIDIRVIPCLSVLYLLGALASPSPCPTARMSSLTG